MPAIALIDDRQDSLQTLHLSLSGHLPEGWTCIAETPPSDPSTILAWIATREIQVLLVDWRLDEGQANTPGFTSADYRGGVVVDTVRGVYPEFPIFVVTSYAHDEELGRRLGDVEEILTRRELTRSPKEHIKRFVRAAARFIESHRRELAELSRLAARAAAGTISREEDESMRALQFALSLPGLPRERITALASLEAEVERFDELAARMKAYLVSRGLADEMD